jgi:outer membrane biosynthesis protein TonB
MEATPMKLAGAIGIAILSLTLGASSAAYAQDQHEQEEQKDKPAQEEKKAQPEKFAKPQEKSAQEDKNAKPEEKSAQQDKTAKPEEKNAQQDKNTKPAEKNAQEQHAAGNRGQIPADKYKANFGQGHTFRVNQGDYSSHAFQYGGYSFGFVGAWPSNWLYTQNVYVIDIDGVYYLCNPMYPGVNVELSVTL